MAILRSNKDGVLKFNLNYFKGSPIEQFEIRQILPMQKVELVVTDGEELTPIDNFEDFEFGEE